MLGIIFYCLGIMYTPGPVNILSLNRGVQNRYTAHIPFCAGVGTALFFLFLLVGYAGSAVIGGGVVPVVSALGTLFILYLAWKIIGAEVGSLEDDGKKVSLTFRDGLLMQLLNPKSFMAVLPVTAVQFPAAGIDGFQISVWSMGLGIMGLGAPLSYAFFGAKLSRFVEKSVYLTWFNRLMGVALILVAVDMAYHHVYLALK